MDMHVHAAVDSGRRWLTLAVLCLGVLMIVVDTTIVNVALPSIRDRLGFTQTSLVWLVNAYTLTFGGSLLLGGRLGDIYGHRRVFLAGIALFTLASLACGLAKWQGVLIAGRAVQGVGGATVVAVALSLIVRTFPEGPERANAIGFYGFVCAAGGSIGLLLGGVLTSVLEWRWIFLINVPIGVTGFVLCCALLRDERTRAAARLDIGGAVTLTGSLMLAVYAVVNSTRAGLMSVQTIGLLSCAALLLASFLAIETRVAAPLVPARIFQLPNFAASNAVRVLWAAGISPWFFVSTLYMQVVLGYGPLQVGLAFLPANLIAGAFSLGLSAKLVARFGILKPLGVGLLLGAIGLALFSRASVDGNVVSDVLPGMVVVALGVGIAFIPLLLVTTNGVSSAEAGLVSGIVNTASMMGSALGLAIIVSIAAARTAELVAAGATNEMALTGGYRMAFLAGATCAGISALVCALFLKRGDAHAVR